MLGVFAFFIAIFIGLCGTMVNGWVLSKLWGWFFIPAVKLLSVNIETGSTTGLAFVLPPITALQGIGIMIVVTFIFQGLFNKVEKILTAIKASPESFADQMGQAVANTIGNVLSSMIILGLAWIWHQFM